MRFTKFLAPAGGLSSGLASVAATAAQPLPWQMGLQPAATPVMASLNDFHNLLLVIIKTSVSCSRSL